MERPSIVVATNETVTDRQLKEILLGMEEEGVPCLVQRNDELNPLTLAHEASLSSRLGVGMGVSLDYVVITTEKLPESRPYIAHLLNHNAATDRTLGATAARIVKRLPLADLRASSSSPAAPSSRIVTPSSPTVPPASAGTSSL